MCSHMLQALARHLAEVLIRGVSETTYQPIEVTPQNAQTRGYKPNVYAGDR